MVKLSGKPASESRMKRAPAADPNLIIDCKIERIELDPTQYKPYSHTLIPEDVCVRVPVYDPDGIKDGNQIILSLEGFTALLSTIATAIDTMHHDRQIEIQKIYQR